MCWDVLLFGRSNEHFLTTGTRRYDILADSMNAMGDEKKDICEGAADRKGRVYALFEHLNIPYETLDHPPLFSQADNEKHRLVIDAVILKNLFLRNKAKSRYYLFSLKLEKRADLPALQKTLGETRLSFGDESALEEKLHIRRGSVSILNIADAAATDVIFLIDREALHYEKIGIHPNDNTATIMFSPHDIPAVLEHFGAQYRFV
jgi:Ala-tRNA(Pro) deacylase